MRRPLVRIHWTGVSENIGQASQNLQQAVSFRELHLKNMPESFGERVGLNCVPAEPCPRNIQSEYSSKTIVTFCGIS